ncbi:TIGR01777 family oxidoreductase [Marinomonas sp.]|nr:TIGR01777 family oxidoreductase [Marinomonas sp.]MDB4837066.1 TIGR01777 family oxidoreductase [Marinomonas sp.]
MKILISGATGFIGHYLLATLLKEKHHIYILVKKHSPSIDSKITQINLAALSDLNIAFDAFINLAGENIASKPWSKKRKLALRASRISLTNNVRKTLRLPPKKVISMSAIGYYGMTKEGVFDEESIPISGFCHELCKDWELAANAFESDKTKVVIFRLGVVLGNGGALGKMRLPFLAGLGGPISDGNQWFSWVHYQDVINAILKGIKGDDYSGTYNLVAPEFITQRQFATSYARTLRRPSFLMTPKFLLSIAFGEMSQLLTEGPRISSQKIINTGFAFKFKKIDIALDDIETKCRN